MVINDIYKVAFVNKNKGEVNYMKIDIKKAKVKNNWTLTLKSTEVSKLSFEADIFNVDMASADGNGTDKVAVKLTLL